VIFKDEQVGGRATQMKFNLKLSNV